MKRDCAKALVLLLAVPLAGAGQKAPVRDMAACSRITVPVSAVYRKKGRPFENLNAADFTARLDGKPAQILSVKPDRAAHRVVLMFDESGSMGIPGSKWHLAVAIAAYVALHLSSQDAVSYMTFSHQPHVVFPFGASSAYLLGDLARTDALREPNPAAWGPTALWDSILFAADQFGAPQPGDAIFVVTDGDDNSSIHSANQARDALLSARVRLFVIAPHPQGSMNDSRNDLPGLAKASGGTTIWEQRGAPKMAAVSVSATAGAAEAWRTYLASPQLAPFLGQMNGLLSQVDDFYDVDLSLPARARDKHQYNLKLGLAKDPATKGLDLAYPEKLPGCVAAAQ